MRKENYHYLQFIPIRLHCNALSIIRCESTQIYDADIKATTKQKFYFEYTAWWNPLISKLKLQYHPHYTVFSSNKISFITLLSLKIITTIIFNHKADIKVIKLILVNSITAH